MIDLRYWLLLQSIEGIGPVTFKNLIDKFSDPKLVFEAEANELQTIPRFSQKIIDQLLRAKERLNEIDIILEQLRNRNIKVITFLDSEYPKQLRTISIRPPIIFILKDIPEGRSVGIIGTRDTSQFGQEKATEFATELSKEGYIIVSGYAKGIDTAAHYGAVIANGKTVAVLPTGILKFRIHEELSQIVEEFFRQSTIISEFFPLDEWSVGNALARNRITSALSDFILVVESGDSGGTVNTVEQAKEQGKKVFLYKGINSSMDERIIALGAIPINSSKELLVHLDT